MQPSVSVIVPVYNIEQYIGKCLDSIIGQTLPLIIGLIISIFQTVTSIQEQTLTFVPKILAVFVGMMIFGSWILTQLTEYITDLWSNFGVFLS